MDDVNVLRQACCRYRNLFLKLAKWTPLGKNHNIVHLQGVPDHVYETWFYRYYPERGATVWDIQAVQDLQWLAYIGWTHNNDTHASNGRDVHLAGIPNVKVDETAQRRMKYLGCFRHECLGMPNRRKTIGKSKENLQNTYEETKAKGVISKNRFSEAKENLGLKQSLV